MKVSFAIVLTALVGSAVGAVIPRGDGPDNGVGNWFGGDKGFGGNWFKGSQEKSSEKDRSASQKGEQNQHQAEDLRKDQGQTDEYKTHDGTDDIWDQEKIKGTKQTTGKETDESVNKDHSDEDKKAFTSYFPPAGYKGDGSEKQKRGDGDGNDGAKSKGDGNDGSKSKGDSNDGSKGDGNGSGDHIKETGTDDHIVKDHEDANRKQLDWTTNEAFEGDRDRKEHKVDHDTDKKQTQNQSEQASRVKDNSNKFENNQNAVDKQASKNTFEGFGNGFGNFDNSFGGWN